MIERIEIHFKRRVSDNKRKEMAMAIAMLLHYPIVYKNEKGEYEGIRYDFYGILKERITRLLNNVLSKNKGGKNGK